MWNRQRQTFVLACVLFFAWVGVLGVMARYSAERPRLRAVVENSR